MRIHCVQHVPFEGPALIGEWARERGHLLSVSMALAEVYPATDSIDWLLIMGGPMAADDHDASPWLPAEKAYVAQSIEAGCMVLGVCLGAQIVAEVIGGEVLRNPEPEIGWWPISLTHTGRLSPVFGVLPDQFAPASWHSDTFSLPGGIATAMSSEVCANQAFEFEDRVWGVQFHLEWNDRSVNALIEECAGDLIVGTYIQSVDELRGTPERFAECKQLLWRLLDAMEDVGPALCG